MNEQKLINKYSSLVILEEGCIKPSWLTVSKTETIKKGAVAELFSKLEPYMSSEAYVTVVTNNSKIFSTVSGYDASLNDHHISIIYNNAIIAKSALLEFDNLEHLLVDSMGNEFKYKEDINSQLISTTDKRVILKSAFVNHNKKYSGCETIAYKYSDEEVGIMLPPHLKADELRETDCIRSRKLSQNIQNLKELFGLVNGLPKNIILFENGVFITDVSESFTDTDLKTFIFKMLFGYSLNEINKNNIIEIITRAFVNDEHCYNGRFIDMLERIFIKDKRIAFDTIKYIIDMEVV